MGGVSEPLFLHGCDSGQAENALASGTEVVGCTSGSTLTGGLITPQALIAGSPYRIGFIIDTSVVLQQADAGIAGFKANNTYTSGPPGTATAMTGGQVSGLLYGNVSGITAHTWLELVNNPALGDLSLVYSDTMNDEDLFTFGTPVSAYAWRGNPESRGFPSLRNA